MPLARKTLQNTTNESSPSNPALNTNSKTSYTPILVILLIIAAFLLGMLITKVQYLEKQKGSLATAGTSTAKDTNQQAGQPKQITNDDIKLWAKDIGLNTQQFNRCFDDQKYKDRVDQDTSAGTAAGVSGTPSFFINGKLLVGALPFDSFKPEIESELSLMPQNSLFSLIDKAYAQASPSPSARVNVGNGNLPPLGNPDAKVVMIEFSDFECPFCNNFFKNTFPQIKKEYIDTGKVVLYYRHYPLTQLHPNAVPFALASECANEQDKFWEMHDKIFGEQ